MRHRPGMHFVGVPFRSCDWWLFSLSRNMGWACLCVVKEGRFH